MNPRQSRESPTPTTTLGMYDDVEVLAETSLRELCELAAGAVGPDVRAFIGLVDPGGARFASAAGTHIDEDRALVVPLCGYAFFKKTFFTITDLGSDQELGLDPRLRQLQVRPRFVAGVQLAGSRGEPLGALVAYSSEPRQLDEGAQRLLAGLGQQAARLVALQVGLSDLRAQHISHLARLETLEGILRAASTVAIISTDERGVVRTFSPGATAVLGRRTDSVVGEPLGREVAGIDLSHGPLGELFEAARAGATKEAEMEWRRGDGRRMPVSVVVSPKLSEEGALTGFVVIARDVSDQRALDRMKDEFISTVSHELRTPLTSIKGSLALVLGGAAGELSDSAQQLLGIAQSNAERLVRLVGDLLDLSKIEAGVEFEKRRCSVNELVRVGVEANRPFAGDRGVVLEIVEELTEDACVAADPERIQQVLTNLLSNAVKYSSEGQEVVASATSGRGESTWRISIADRGPGIPEAFRPRLFERFTQAREDGARRSGTGLGLSIAKSIVERHGGEIGFETELGQGTTFWFELPRCLRAG